MSSQASGGRENVVEVALTEGLPLDLDSMSRHLFASASCGLCGKLTIDAVRQQFSPIDTSMEVPASVVAALPRTLRASQHGFDRTGGLHAAGIFDANGDLVVLREDIGRHNAVDKVLGYALRRGLLPFARHVLLVSGRASFEILQKALAASVPVVAAVSAPSSLAVEFARDSGITLVGFLRDARMNVYSHVERLRFD